MRAWRCMRMNSKRNWIDCVVSEVWLDGSESSCMPLAVFLQSTISLGVALGEGVMLQEMEDDWPCCSKLPLVFTYCTLLMS